MEYQNLVIDKLDAFDLEDIFECGQCFRWNKQNDGSYTGVVKNGVLNVWCDESKIYFKGIMNGNLKQFVNKYFDFDRNYNLIKEQFASIDEYMKESIKYGAGIRILNQDLWEMIISYIISANNNIPRIKGIIENLSKKYGTMIMFEDKMYYLFPSAEQLKDVTVSEYRALGLGFRDIRLYETTQLILNKSINLEELYMLDTPTAKNELMKLSGVGPKVADCILLFSDLKRFDSFPIDVWVRRVMNDLYVKSDDESRVSKNVISEIAYKKFGNLAGLAQQYLYHWRRNCELLK